MIALCCSFVFLYATLVFGQVGYYRPAVGGAHRSVRHTTSPYVSNYNGVNTGGVTSHTTGTNRPALSPGYTYTTGTTTSNGLNSYTTGSTNRPALPPGYTYTTGTTNGLTNNGVNSYTTSNSNRPPLPPGYYYVDEGPSSVNSNSYGSYTNNNNNNNNNYNRPPLPPGYYYTDENPNTTPTYNRPHVTPNAPVAGNINWVTGGEPVFPTPREDPPALTTLSDASNNTTNTTAPANSTSNSNTNATRRVIVSSVPTAPLPVTAIAEPLNTVPVTDASVRPVLVRG